MKAYVQMGESVNILLALMGGQLDTIRPGADISGDGRFMIIVFEVTRQAFYKTTLSYAIVNIKPIVPGHVLVIPTRPVPRLADLDASELTSLMHSVQRVGSVIERVYGADALTIACQDGKAAGQSVPHVHFHLLPRKAIGDHFSGNNDAIYPALEDGEGNLASSLGKPVSHEPFKVDADEARLPRSLKEMEQEAQWLETFFMPEDTLQLS